jgi:hypothetical protein
MIDAAHGEVYFPRSDNEWAEFDAVTNGFRHGRSFDDSEDMLKKLVIKKLLADYGS